MRGRVSAHAWMPVRGGGGGGFGGRKGRRGTKRSRLRSPSRKACCLEQAVSGPSLVRRWYLRGHSPHLTCT